MKSDGSKSQKQTASAKENDEVYNKEIAVQKLSNRLYKKSKKRELMQAQSATDTAPADTQPRLVEFNGKSHPESEAGTEGQKRIVLLKNETKPGMLKPVKSSSHSSVVSSPTIRITVIQSQSNESAAATTELPRKSQSQPTSPTKKPAAHKRKVAFLVWICFSESRSTY